MKKRIVTVFVFAMILIPFTVWSAELKDGRIYFGTMGYVAEKLVVPSGQCGLTSVQIPRMDREGSYLLVISDVPADGGFPNVLYQTPFHEPIYPAPTDGPESILVDMREQAGSELGDLIQSEMEIMIGVGYYPEGKLPFSVPVSSGATEVMYGEIDDSMLLLISLLAGNGGTGTDLGGLIGGDLGGLTGGDSGLGDLGDLGGFAGGDSGLVDLGDLGGLAGGDSGLPFSVARNSRASGNFQFRRSAKSEVFPDLGGLFGAGDSGTDTGLGDLGGLFGDTSGLGGLGGLLGGSSDLGIFGGGLDGLLGDNLTSVPGYTAFSVVWRGQCNCMENNCIPFFTKGADQIINEDAGLQTVPAWAKDIHPGCPEESDQILTFHVSTGSESLFAPDGKPQIDPATGNLTYTPAPDAFGTAWITVVLKDDGGSACDQGAESDAENFSILVDFINDAPSFTKGADQTVGLNAGQQTVQQWASDISPGAGNESFQELTFLLTTDNDALFSELPQIDAITGNLTYKSAPDAQGTAIVTVRLKDDGGTENLGLDSSEPQQFRITVDPSLLRTKQLERDIYEPDNTPEQASVIVINDEAQTHNFHDAEDVADWVKFYGLAETSYEIESKNAGQNCDIAIELYDSDLAAPEESADRYGPGQDELLSWLCPEDGVYYVKLTNMHAGASGENTAYEFAVNYTEAGPDEGVIQGYITYCVTGDPVAGVTVRTTGKRTAISDAEGFYRIINHPSGQYAMTVSADCYKSFKDSVNVEKSGTADKSVCIVSIEKGSVNADDVINLADAVLALQITAGMVPSTTICHHLEINNDGRVGLAEAIYVLRRVADGF